MPDGDYVNAHGLEGESGIEQGLAFLHAAAGLAHVDDVGAQHLPRFLEGDPGAGAGLVEEGDYQTPSEGGSLFDVAMEDVLHRGGVVQDGWLFRPG